MRSAMAQRETNLEQITTWVGQCLGRIEAQAFQLQVDAEQNPEAAAAALEHHAAELQELVGALLVAEQARLEDAEADLNPIVDRAVRGCVAEAMIPVVTRQNLQRDLPHVACPPGQLAFAVQRAVMLGLAQLQPGDELRVATRMEADAAVFELETHGSGSGDHCSERAASLIDFATNLGGNCRIDFDGQGRLLLALELPLVHAIGGH